MFSRVFDRVKCKMHVVMEVGNCVSIPSLSLATECVGYA